MCMRNSGAACRNLTYIGDSFYQLLQEACVDIILLFCDRVHKLCSAYCDKPFVAKLFFANQSPNNN